MGSPTYTYTLTNNTTADATQVMQDFNDILNGVTDGTKDLNVSALTAAGAATFNGNITLGNSSVDDLTIGASLASNLIIKTTNTYDIGSSTIGLRALYLGANSQTTKVVGNASMAATYTLALPANVGDADDYIVRGTTAGVLSFQKPGPITATGSDADTTLALTASRHQIITPTADRSYTLPTTSVIAGDIFYVSNNCAVSAGFNISIKASGGTTVRTVYPQTTGVVMALQNTPTTSAHWVSLNQVTSNIQSYTPTTAGLGTVSAVVFTWRRVGAFLEIRGRLTSGTPSGAQAATLSLPTGAAIDTTNLVTQKVAFGRFSQLVSAASTIGTTLGACFYSSGVGTGSIQFALNSESNVYKSEVASAIFSSGNTVDIPLLTIPISGWSDSRG